MFINSDCGTSFFFLIHASFLVSSYMTLRSIGTSLGVVCVAAPASPKDKIASEVG